MNARDIFVAAQPFVVGIGVPLAALVLPITYLQGRDIQKLVDSVDTIKADVSAIKATVEALDKRERLSESDPELVMSKMLGASAKDFVLGPMIFVNNKLVVFPRNVDDRQRLTDAGYMLVSVTPTISGYVAPLSVENAIPKPAP